MNLKIGPGTVFILILLSVPLWPAILGFLAQTGILAALILIFGGSIILALWVILVANLQRINREQKYFAQSEQKIQVHQVKHVETLVIKGNSPLDRFARWFSHPIIEEQRKRGSK